MTSEDEERKDEQVVMEHERANELLSEHLEGSLDEAQTRALEQHLAECEACSQDLSMLKRAMDMIRALPEAEAPPHFARRVHRRARQAGLMRRQRRSLASMSIPFSSTWTTWTLMLAVAFLLIIVLIAQQQIVLLTVEPLPTRIDLADTQALDATCRCAWQQEAQVTQSGQTLAPGYDLSQVVELETRLQSHGWSGFVTCMHAAGLAAQLPQQAPPAGPDGRIRLWLRIDLQGPGKSP